jgi:hypothetical protein
MALTNARHYHVHHMSLGCVVGDGDLPTFLNEKDANDYVRDEARAIFEETPGARITGPRGNRTVTWGIAGESHIYSDLCFEEECTAEAA